MIKIKRLIYEQKRSVKWNLKQLSWVRLFFLFLFCYFYFVLFLFCVCVISNLVRVKGTKCITRTTSHIRFDRDRMCSINKRSDINDSRIYYVHSFSLERDCISGILDWFWKIMPADENHNFEKMSEIIM